jgi:MFS family permease
MSETIVPVFGHILAISAALCGFAAWIFLALGLAYARFIVPEKKTRPAVLPPRTASRLFTIAISACIASAGLLLGVIALFVGYSPHWAWAGVATGGAFWVSFGMHGVLYKWGLLPKGF